MQPKMIVMRASREAVHKQGSLIDRIKVKRKALKFLLAIWFLRNLITYRNLFMMARQIDKKMKKPVTHYPDQGLKIWIRIKIFKPNLLHTQTKEIFKKFNTTRIEVNLELQEITIMINHVRICSRSLAIQYSL